jgi:hypothetical protein
MDPVKVQGVTNWPTPKNKKEVQSFLGFCNFYCWFVKDYAGIAHPLAKLTGDSLFEWNEEQVMAFTQLKTLLAAMPDLVIPSYNDPLRLEMDASAFAMGAVLSRK